jgi:Uma2 family endonuclease
VGERVPLAPQGSSIVNLDQAAPPDLAIEIADSSLNDDLGKKRLLYEDLGVSEYWVIDAETAQIIAFQMVGNGSKRIQQSQVLQNLKIALVRAAIEQRRQMDDSQLVAWLMTQLRPQP